MGARPVLLWGPEMRSDTWQFTRARVKAFTHESIRLYAVALDPDGNVRVWDSVAQQYTVAHAISDRAINRIRRELKGV